MFDGVSRDWWPLDFRECRSSVEKIDPSSCEVSKTNWSISSWISTSSFKYPNTSSSYPSLSSFSDSCKSLTHPIAYFLSNSLCHHLKSCISSLRWWCTCSRQPAPLSVAWVRRRSRTCSHSALFYLMSDWSSKALFMPSRAYACKEMLTSSCIRYTWEF